MPNIKKSEYLYLQAAERNLNHEKLKVKKLEDKLYAMDERRRIINEDSLTAISKMVWAVADTIQAMNKEEK